jgi:hypothetical protein
VVGAIAALPYNVWVKKQQQPAMTAEAIAP